MRRTKVSILKRSGRINFGHASLDTQTKYNMRQVKARSFTIVLLSALACDSVISGEPAPHVFDRMAEWTIESRKTYIDPFNAVDVDVIFSREGSTWRVPAFWCGGQKWTVRFAPPSAGEYSYRLESTDPGNPDLNGSAGLVKITAYKGPNELLRRGILRVSANRRYFEHADGTPFYWLGDTWWQGLSDRLSWRDFQRLAADRKAKGFTVIQIVAGLVPVERAPSDPGFCNEGGCVWDPDYKQINPAYFDYADRRIRYLLDNDLVPAIVGGWGTTLPQLGAARMKKQWRYIIGRYGAYPTFWILGGELFDAPQRILDRLPKLTWPPVRGGWTEVARYVRATDPYGHPLTAHELPAPVDAPLQDESLMDFDLFQSGHFGWPSIAESVAKLNLHYARTFVTKPIVQGEIGYENHHLMHYEDFQRVAFWLSMLNGAAGHTYGADATWGMQIGEKPLHRMMMSFLSWEEGMKLPGSYQVGLGAKLLRQYPWWRFQPHPEWVTPRGTTLLEPRARLTGEELGLQFWTNDDAGERIDSAELDYPQGEWKARHGTFRRPYAAGIPREVRFIYVPPLSKPGVIPDPPTVLGLELGVRYHAYFWHPALGIRFDLGTVQRPAPGPLLFSGRFDPASASHWIDPAPGKYTQEGLLTVLKGAKETNVVAMVEGRSSVETALILRFRDAGNYIAAVYVPEDKVLYLVNRRAGADGPPLGKTAVAEIGADMRLSAEVRDEKGLASLTDGRRTYTTSIVDLGSVEPGGVGLRYRVNGGNQRFAQFELRRSPMLIENEALQRELYDAANGYRGELSGPDVDVSSTGWDRFGRDKHILLDAYRPERLPSEGDWILVLEAAR